MYSQRGGGERGVGALELAVERDAALVAVAGQRRRQVQHLLQARARLQGAAVPGHIRFQIISTAVGCGLQKTTKTQGQLQ